MDKNVIKELRVKAEDGSFPANARFPISTDPKYISPIRGSSLNNLEEQLILGPNCIKSYWTDIDTFEHPKYPGMPIEWPVAHTRIEYREDIENPTNYYVLDIVNKAFTSFAFGTWFGKEEALVRTTESTGDFFFDKEDDFDRLEFSTVLDKIKNTSMLVLSEAVIGCFQSDEGGYIKEPEFLVYHTGIGGESAWNEFHELFDYLGEMPYKTYTLSFMKNKEATPIPIIEKNEKILSFPNIHLDHYDSDTDRAYIKIDGMNEEKYNELKDEHNIGKLLRELPYFFTIKETTENKLIGG